MLIHKFINLTKNLFLRHLNRHSIMHFKFMLEIWYIRVVNVYDLLFEILVPIYLIRIVNLVLCHLQRVLIFGKKNGLILMQGVDWKFDNRCINIFHVWINNHILLEYGSALHGSHTIVRHSIDLLPHGCLHVNRLLLLTILIHYRLLVIHHHFRWERVDHLIRILNILLVHLLRINNILLNNISVHIDDLMRLTIKSLVLLKKNLLLVQLLNG